MVSMSRVRVRRLSNAGPLGWGRTFDVEVQPTPSDWDSPTVRTHRPYRLLRDLVGWEEASLVVRRASEAWQGGTGPWVTALTGVESDQ